MSFFQDKPLDHGCFSPLSMLLPHEPDVAGRDRAAAGRRAAVPDPHGAPLLQARPGAAPGDRELSRRTCSVAIVATGGLSHQVHGERAGFNNTAVGPAVPRPDRERSRDARRDDARRLRDARRHRGRRGHHVAGHARRAVGAACAVHRSYYLPSMTGIATAIYENDRADGRRPRRGRALPRATSAHQLAGVEKLDRHLSVHARRAASRRYRINKFLHALIEPAHRARFLADPEAPSPRPASPTRNATWSAAATGAA